MTDLRTAAQQALEALELGYDSAKAEADQYHAAMAGYRPQRHAEMDADVQKIARAITALRAALAEPVQEPFFTEANGFPQTFVPKDRQKQAIISLTDQCAALIQERDELQKQVWRYEKNGVTCQTYRHTVEQSCAECNVQMSYTAPPQRKPLTEEEIENAYREIWRDLPSDFDHTSSGWIEQGIKYAEQAHGIKDA